MSKALPGVSITPVCSTSRTQRSQDGTSKSYLSSAVVPERGLTKLTRGSADTHRSRVARLPRTMRRLRWRMASFFSRAMDASRSSTMLTLIVL